MGQRTHRIYDMHLIACHCKIAFNYLENEELEHAHHGCMMLNAKEEVDCSHSRCTERSPFLYTLRLSMLAYVL